MKSKHHMKKNDKDIIILDDNSVWRLDMFGSSKPTFWSTFDDLEIDDSGFNSSITNLKKNETVKAQKIS
jgi:hypothetical protein